MELVPSISKEMLIYRSAYKYGEVLASLEAWKGLLEFSGTRYI